MTENIRDIFDQNIMLLGEMEKAIFYFREQQYDRALGLVAHGVDLLKNIFEAIIADREYFNRVDTGSMLEMLTSILEAKRNKDMILLADLLELQLVNFLTRLQEMIMSKEEIVFDEESYQANLRILHEHSIGIDKEFFTPIDTATLLESGYRIEFTSCGQMTLAAENNGTKFYFHTNNRIHAEAFLLAKNWFQPDKSAYVVYGFGLGYHLQELQSLAPDAWIEVYESDKNVLQLACAFTDIKEILLNKRLRIVYDPDLRLLKKRLGTIRKEEKIVIHYPSYRNIKENENRAILEELLPWAKVMESI